MNYRVILNILARILLIEAALMLLPVIVALIYGEGVWAFLITMAILLAAGGLMMMIPVKSRRIYAREGYITVAVSWIIMSLAGALPFTLSGCIPNYIDAVFETVSGFTTTGSSILTDVEALPQGMLFWRSLTHWVGGMGVLVFALAVMPMSNERSMYIMRAEVTGPTKGKLVPKIRSTALILYAMYVLLTILQVIFLLPGGINLYDALIIAFGTAGTGGFSNYNASVGHFDSAYIEMVTAVFLLLYGVNFSLYYLMLLRRFKDVVKNEELWWYLGIIAASTLFITLNILPEMGSAGQSLRYAFFQVSSIATTAGFATYNYQEWHALSRAILLGLMFVGSCAGSTAGGIKVSRLILAGKAARKEIRQLIQPRSVTAIRLNGQPLEDGVIRTTLVFISCYAMLTILSTMFISCFDFDLETAFSATVACLSNIGPGFGMVSPAGNFSVFPVSVKLVLCLDMLLGRLEIYPILMLLSRTTWRRRN